MYLFSLYFLLSAIIDFFWYKIPNYLTLGIFPVILFYKFFHDGPHALVDSFVTYFLVYLVLFVPFVFRILGAGDIKFLASIAALVGFSEVMHCFAYGIICSIPIAVYFGLQYYERFSYWLKHRELPKVEKIYFPYSIPFAMGVIIYIYNPIAFAPLLSIF